MRRAFGHALVGVVLSCQTGAFAQYLDQPRSRCPVDIAEPFGVLDFFDVSKYLQWYVAGDLRADTTEPWGEINFFDLVRFLYFFNLGCDIDSDGDGIPDWAETNDGVFRGYFATGTDPHNWDTDGDGLSDGDEIFGTLDGLDLPALGADPLRKDIFVECDWFAGEFEGVYRDFRPRPEAIARVVEAFANAPVPNPYGAPDGINIHFDFGQGGVFTGGNQIPGNPLYITFPEQFDQFKEEHFDPRRLGYFHYAIFAYRYDSPTNRSSGVGHINGDSFMVTMVDYLTNFNQSQTIMHELGHNLGLRHGGFENRNWKPNYNSVMNYRHQFPGVDITGDSFGNGVLDYSRGFNFDLDENAIYEPDGVIGIPVDFNRDGVIQTTHYALNINCPFGGTPCGTQAQCWDSSCTILRDHDDWSNLNWLRLVGVRSGGPVEISRCRSEPLPLRRARHPAD